jgi:hypothetical protein
VSHPRQLGDDVMPIHPLADVLKHVRHSPPVGAI